MGGRVVSNTPKELWEAAVGYFSWCDENPIKAKRTLTSGKEAGKIVTIEKARPYTIEGFCIHAGIDKNYILSLKAMKSAESEYYAVMELILNCIRVQNIEQAVVGEFNPIFTAKVLNMDNEDTPTTSIKVEIIGNQPALPESENEVLKNLDLEDQADEHAA